MLNGQEKVRYPLPSRDEVSEADRAVSGIQAGKPDLSSLPLEMSGAWDLRLKKKKVCVLTLGVISVGGNRV